MSNAQKAAFYERYAPLAIEQQQRYGIPASVTLAQMYIESGGGMSRLAVNGNNFFGIKCSRDWLAAGKPFSLHDDDRPGEKFCNYACVEESVRHHSQLLMGSRYARCRQCACDDYRGWSAGLQSAGYATDRHYASSLIADIEAYNLQRFDRQGIVTATQPIGYARDERWEGRGESQAVAVTPRADVVSSGAYRLPVGDGSVIVVTSLYGRRDAPAAGASSFHKGIDISARYENVYSTERGTVISVGSDSKSGNYVVIAYERSDGKDYKVSFCHLDNGSVSVREGDIVESGDVIARSGATGVGTGPHLHLTVRQDDGTGNYHHVNPLDYLAEITVRGSLTGAVLRKGTREDLLAGRLADVDISPTPHEVLLAQQSDKVLTPEQYLNASKGATLAHVTGSNDPSAVLSYLMGRNNDHQQGGDLLSSLISDLFMAVMAMAMQLDHAGCYNNEETVMAHRRLPETDEECFSTLIRRERESVDPKRARELSAMYFDAEYPEQQRQGHGQRMA